MKKAMSLYELVIVIAIIGISAAAVVISLQDLRPSWQLNNNSKIVSTKLRQAQEEAVTTQKQHMIRFDGSGPVKLKLIKVDNGEHEIESIDLDKNIQVILDPIFSNKVTFSSDGSPSNSGNIEVKLGEAKKTITILPAGTIKLQ